MKLENLTLKRKKPVTEEEILTALTQMKYLALANS